MTAWILRKFNTAPVPLDSRLYPWTRSLAFMVVLPLALYVLARADTILFELIVNTLADAFLGVSIFVAMTLGVFYFLDQALDARIVKSLNRRTPWQVPCAAFLGALPGCGGAIIVVTQYVNGRMSFGALVAVLISTMGDAAFLLLTREPETALLVYSVSFVTGILTGVIVNFIHGGDFLRVRRPTSTEAVPALPRLPPQLVILFTVLLLPGCVFGVMDALMFDPNSMFGRFANLEPVKWWGFLGAIVCAAIWISQPVNSWSVRFGKITDRESIAETIAEETSFISVWVITGFLVYELLIYFTGIDLADYFFHLGAFAPLLAVIIGFIPGCGPQILVTTLYLNGAIPLSCQLANAISNDGDALFPAIALAPYAAIVATAYSAIPGLLLGYIAFSYGW